MKTKTGIAVIALASMAISAPGCQTAHAADDDPEATTTARADRPHNTITPEEEAEGWVLLFDGESLEHWRGFRREDMPDGWQAVDGTLARVAGAGDIITREKYENFDLRLEWKVEPGGNSGIFWRVSEDHGAVWLTGPEMQVLDDERHPDGRDPKTSAGSDYALYAPKHDAVKPAGEFNKVRIVVRDNHVRYWLNGHKVVEYELHSEDWVERVRNSKFRDMPYFGRIPRGHIALQDHGDLVQYRNIMIRELD